VLAPVASIEDLDLADERSSVSRPMSTSDSPDADFAWEKGMSMSFGDRQYFLSGEGKISPTGLVPASGKRELTSRVQ